MAHFLDTVDTIPEGVGFKSFGLTHSLWLIGFALFTALCCVLYKKLSEHGRKIFRIATASLIVADEIFKIVCLCIEGNYSPSYLPLHLCSINIFFIAFHAFKPTRFMGNFLYTVCIPGALMALLFPTWTALPFGNFMHMHSFSVHILLAAYPIILTVCGEIKPDSKQIPKCLMFLAALAVPIYIFNLIADTNFMFLISADPGNPLYYFEQLFGHHEIGFPVLIAAVLAVMHIPFVIYGKFAAKKTA